MAKHHVTFTLPERPLGKVDAEFIIEKDDKPFGTLKLSSGGPEWVPTRLRKSCGKMSWSRLAKLIEGWAESKNKKKKA